MPVGAEPWLHNVEASTNGELKSPDALSEHLARLAHCGDWQWPSRPIYFLSDLHADTRALVESLALAGLVEMIGQKTREFVVTDRGRQGTVVIGGDCLDKGPSNLKLLNYLHRLRSSGMEIVMLAGNHDLRLPLGLERFGKPPTVFNEHLFVRMGAKTMPLLEEIWRKRLRRSSAPLSDVPDKKACHRFLLPGDDWPERFRAAARDVMPALTLEKEINRILEKKTEFKTTYKALGLNVRSVYAAAREAHRMFIQPGGEFSWFLQSLKLAHREGSLLFLHAGVDDTIAQGLSDRGVDAINNDFQVGWDQDLFTLYSGRLGNALRTKYRPVDYPLTRRGAEALHRAGCFAIVHGHRSSHSGQRMALRSGYLHIEGDVTLDRNTRALEGLERAGAGIIMIQPDGQIIGMSSDHPTAKVFNPAHLSGEKQQ